MGCGSWAYLLQLVSRMGYRVFFWKNRRNFFAVSPFKLLIRRLRRQISHLPKNALSNHSRVFLMIQPRREGNTDPPHQPYNPFNYYKTSGKFFIRPLFEKDREKEGEENSRNIYADRNREPGKERTSRRDFANNAKVSLEHAAPRTF